MLRFREVLRFGVKGPGWTRNRENTTIKFGSLHTGVMHDRDLQREFAVEVVRKLREARFEALWAGGCVRDQLLGLEPKDYDVATSAHPEQVRDLFGRRRTLPIGASFGVISVLGPKEIRPIEVATFRSDGQYTDGRHPDAVAFSTPQEDAQRRDFTINGLFFDPIAETVHDYVGGQDDLQAGRIRAIGEPEKRFREDHLRLLRGVRFAARFGFRLEKETAESIKRLAPLITKVSAERIAAEFRMMLIHPQRAEAVELLMELGLDREVLPEIGAEGADDPSRLAMLAMLRVVHEPSFPVALSILIRAFGSHESGEEAAKNVYKVGARWRLSNEEVEIATRMMECEAMVRNAHTLPWPQVQRILAGPWTRELIHYCQAVISVYRFDPSGLELCRNKLSLPLEEWNPKPLLNGDDLRTLGVPPGPDMKRLLNACRDAQLEGKIHTKEEACRLVKKLLGSP